MRKKRLVVVEEAPEPDKNEDIALTPEEDAELQDQEQSREWLSEFQSRFSDQPVRILVEKYDEAGDWALCHKYPLSSFDQEAVKQEYGGGKYRGTLFDPKGHYIKGGRIHFKFAETINKGLLPVKAENPLENPIVAMLFKMQEDNRTSMMNLMQTIMTAQTAAAPKTSGLGEIVEVMKSLKTMTPTEKPIDNFKDTLSVMKLFKEVTGDSDGESKGGLLSDLKEVLEVLPQLKEQMTHLKPPVQGTPGLITPGLVNPTENPPMDPLTQKVVQVVPKFIEAGKAAAPVEEWGDFLLETFDTEFVPLLLPSLRKQYPVLVKTEDDVYDIVLKLAKDPGEREKIFQTIKPLSPYRDWALRVIDEAVRLAETPDVEEAHIVAQTGVTGGSAILTAVEKNGHQEE